MNQRFLEASVAGTLNRKGLPVNPSPKRQRGVIRGSGGAANPGRAAGARTVRPDGGGNVPPPAAVGGSGNPVAGISRPECRRGVNPSPKRQRGVLPTLDNAGIARRVTGAGHVAPITVTGSAQPVARPEARQPVACARGSDGHHRISFGSSGVTVASPPSANRFMVAVWAVLLTTTAYTTRADTLECPTVSNGGGVLSNGSVVIIGEAFVGTVSNAQYSIELGSLSCLLGVSDPPGEVEPPLIAPFPHDRRKNRYISFDPNKAESDGTSIAFKVELTAITLGSCSGAAGDPAQVDFCRADRGADDCNTCAGAPAENACINQPIDCASGTCTPTGETCVNDAPNAGGSNVGTVWWVGPEQNGIHLLVSMPFRKESTNWANPVHAGDCEVVPEARYGVRAVDAGSGGESAELLVETTLFATASASWWGDCVGPLKKFCGGDIRTPECTSDGDCIAPATCDRAWTLPEGSVNVDDITAALWASAPAPPTTVAAEFTWVDLHGNGSFLPGSQAYDPPNYVINVSDLQQVISAFGGRPYTFYDPADCPLLGACCDGATCTEETEVSCVADGRAFQGNGITCTPNPCP